MSGQAPLSRYSAPMNYPQRIVCLTEETTETLYAIGAEPGARERIIENPEDVIARQPDIIIGSWYGRKFRPEQVAERPGWAEIPALALVLLIRRERAGGK